MSKGGRRGAGGYLAGGYDAPPEVTTMARPTDVKARPRFHIWIRYDDGIEGDVDLSHLVGRGVFKAWDDPKFFNEVHLGAHGSIEWGDQIDLCPDAVYMRLTGKSPEGVFPALKWIPADA